MRNNSQLRSLALSATYMIELLEVESTSYLRDLDAEKLILDQM